MNRHFLFVYALFVVSYKTAAARYAPTWDSLDKRVIPAWYDESKVGIFIHWGVFSVPSFGQKFAGEWFWQRWKESRIPAAIDFMKRNYPPDFEYADFGPEFTAEFFDANQWADLFKASGARYIVFTSKHHEGFTNWPSSTSWNWNSMDIGPKRDIVGELAAAIRNRTSIHFGLYHSLFEWYNPLFLQDQKNGFRTQDFVRKKTMPELYDIVHRYKPELIWSDGEWHGNSDYWDSKNFLAWLYNSSPVKKFIVTNDRWGNATMCKHGGFLTCSDRYNPEVLKSRKWEGGLTIDGESWGFRRNADLSSYLKIEDILQRLVTTISCNGNFIVNVGPTKEGTISPIFEERLRQMGKWLGINGEGIYKSKPWKHQNDTLTPGVWYTSYKEHVYAFVFEWAPLINLASPIAKSAVSTVDLLGGTSRLVWNRLKPSGIQVYMPYNPNLQWVWALRLTGFD